MSEEQATMFNKTLREYSRHLMQKDIHPYDHKPWAWIKRRELLRKAKYKFFKRYGADINNILRKKYDR